MTPETDDDIFGRQFVKRVVSSRPLLAGNHCAMDAVFHDETTYKDHIPFAHSYTYVHTGLENNELDSGPGWVPGDFPVDGRP